MAKKELPDTEVAENTLTPELIAAIEALVGNQRRMMQDKEAYNDDLKAVAERLGVKSGVLSKRVAMIIKEEEKGGELQSQNSNIDFVQKYFTTKNS